MPPHESSSGEHTWAPRPNADRCRSRSRELSKPSQNSRVVCASSSTSNENEAASRGDETAWEKGLRQAREMMIKASRKREEEPDFDRKRLVLAPSEDMDQRRTSDDESDDSRIHRGLRRRASRSPFSRSAARSACGLVSQMDGDLDSSRSRRHNISLGPDGDGRRRQDGRCGRDEPRQPPKDLGPQVLYPNGRPTARRRPAASARKTSPTDRYYVPRRVSVPRSSPSPHSQTPRDSRSPSPYRSFSRSPRRRTSPTSADSRRERYRKRNTDPVTGLAFVIKRHPTKNIPSSLFCLELLRLFFSFFAGDRIHDPWERTHKKERSRDEDLLSTTLGAELQKARRQQHRQRAASRGGSAGRRSGSGTTSATSRSQSPSHTSSQRRQQSISLASAVASKNLIDEDGAVRATDLSSFRIPKKKRPSSPPRRFSVMESSRKHLLPPRDNKTLNRDLSPSWKVDISSNESSESSSSWSSSSSDDTEPAAYRLKRKADVGPSAGISLSPGPAAEDVSSDEDEDGSETRAVIASEPPKKKSSAGSSRHSSRRADDDDYVDDEAEKEERRAQLLRQLKCVEDAIARKRSRPVA
ncbi:unnamed protein product [Gongylonema pulchrum]|uniref:Protein kinase domain-containing protein n=1 Tax=Gongylonema pulchrum TaxID=637853 RepID=A0A183DQ93_9BILA|nr:unnamed protein product [Gongylonema pulchrum]